MFLPSSHSSRLRRLSTLSLKDCRSPSPSSSPFLFDFLLISALCLLVLLPLLFVVFLFLFFLLQRGRTTAGRKDRRRSADRSMRLLLLSLQCNKRTLPMVRLFPSEVINIRGYRRQAAIVQAMLQLGLFTITIVYVLLLSRFAICLHF